MLEFSSLQRKPHRSSVKLNYSWLVLESHETVNARWQTALWESLSHKHRIQHVHSARLLFLTVKLCVNQTGCGRMKCSEIKEVQYQEIASSCAKQSCCTTEVACSALLTDKEELEHSSSFKWMIYNSSVYFLCKLISTLSIYASQSLRLWDVIIMVNTILLGLIVHLIK